MDQNKMIEEFNVQRAKMKELYLQKHGLYLMFTFYCRNKS